MKKLSPLLAGVPIAVFVFLVAREAIHTAPVATADERAPAKHEPIEPAQQPDDQAVVAPHDEPERVAREPDIPASLEEALYLEAAIGLDDAYIPSKEALQYHVGYHVEQIADLTLEQVRALYADGWGDWQEYAALCVGDETLERRLGFPTPADADRIWNAPGFQDRFHVYLDLEHRSFVQYELGVGAYDDPGMVDLSKQTGALAGEAWGLLWQTPDIYPHWAFVFETARRHQR